MDIQNFLKNKKLDSVLPLTKNTNIQNHSGIWLKICKFGYVWIYINDQDPKVLYYSTPKQILLIAKNELDSNDELLD